MKLLVIGCGQCGGRIADEFARLGKVARSQRGVDILTNILAVNTDVADLSGLVNIKSDYADTDQAKKLAVWCRQIK